MRLANFALSARKNLASSSGEVPTGSAPTVASFSLTSGSLSERLISALSLAITSVGVPAGAKKANQLLMSNPGTPASSIVGTSGVAAERRVVVTASARSLPERTWGIAGGIPEKNIG